MLPESIQLIVVTPERQLLRESALEVGVPGLDGQLGILPGHAPLMTELGIGELSYRTSSSSQPIVLAETAERAEEIDLARAEEAKARAEKRLSAGDTNLDWDRANIALQRSLIRIQVARRHRSVPVESR